MIDAIGSTLGSLTTFVHAIKVSLLGQLISNNNIIVHCNTCTCRPSLDLKFLSLFAALMAYVSMSFSSSNVLQNTIIIISPYLVHVDYSYNISFNTCTHGLYQEYTIIIIIIRSIIIRFEASVKKA